MTAICKICGSRSCLFTNKKILKKYQVNYFQCSNCLFIQSEPPFWLKEAYDNAITPLDIGLVYRNEFLVPIVSAIIHLFFDDKSKFLDYGGGYGLFVRMMRDRGFEFYRQDIYCQNIFAKHFDMTDLPSLTKFEMITTFEVFEHLEHPLQEIEKILQIAPNILFTTELQPASVQNLQDWWYFIPETGQHISLYSRLSLEWIARKYSLHLLSYQNVHLLSASKKNPFFYRKAFGRIFQKVINIRNRKPSLLEVDYKSVKTNLQKSQ